MTVHLDILLPLPLTQRGTSYTCGMIARGMATSDFAVTIVTPRARGYTVRPANVVEVLPGWARHVPYRWVKERAVSNIERAFLTRLGNGESRGRGAYIWPDATAGFIAALKDAGIVVFREMINGHRGSSKLILDRAYRQFGLEPRHGITAESVIEEQRRLEAADYIFCPNAMVDASLRSHNLAESKFIQSSYGWDPARFLGKSRLLPPCDGLTAVFVGSVCIRKGCHLLLDYWARSKVRGRLVLAGEMDPTIREQCAPLLAREDVVVLDYVRDIGALYRSADVFVFPSLEEGGPQVTYEACGVGLPAITTPMGAGRIVRHGREGMVLDPYDREGWIGALQMMAEDHASRARMAEAARARAKLFHWDSVAERRKQQIAKRITNAKASLYEDDYVSSCQ